MAALARHFGKSRFLRFFHEICLQGRVKTIQSKRAKSFQLVQLLTRLRRSWYVLFTTPTLSLGWFSNSSQETAPTKQLTDEELAIIDADKLFDDNDINNLYELLLKFEESKNAAIAWRLARAARNKAEVSGDVNDKKKFTYKAYEYAKKAVELDNNNFACHKWLGITLSNVGDFEGNKIKIQNAYKIRDHFEKAIRLNPDDPTCRYLLGVWCFTFADMPWYQQKLAAAIFATPPSSSYREALDHFEMAEALEAGFFSKNTLMIGKANLRMGKYDDARVWLQRAARCDVKTVDDQQAKKEAEELLKHL